MQVGVSGGIDNFIDDLRTAARESNGFVLEIGVSTGTGSTVAFSEGLSQAGVKEKLHISVDQLDEMVWKPREAYWHLVVGDSRSLETLERVKELAKGRKAGVIFIDTDHYYEHMQKELEVWKEMAGDETVWLFHDTHMFGFYNHMNDAIEEFAEKNGWVWEDWKKEMHGLGRMRK
jgi:cephalosporin hydroxylase